VTFLRTRGGDQQAGGDEEEEGNLSSHVGRNS
jgi:hypothetical protein